MTGDVRAAAERQRILRAVGGTMDAAYGTNLSLEGQRIYCSFDSELLARAWLAEHPADDDEPLSAEWVATATGWHQTPGRESFEWYRPADESGLIGCRLSRCAGDKGQWAYSGRSRSATISSATVRTRGDLRAACRYLGITLKEPDPCTPPDC